MGQEPSGLIEGARKVYDRVTGAINRIPTPGYKPRSEPAPDDSVHRRQVEAANESFRRTQKTTKRTAKKTSKRK